MHSPDEHKQSGNNKRDTRDFSNPYGFFEYQFGKQQCPQKCQRIGWHNQCVGKLAKQVNVQQRPQTVTEKTDQKQLDLFARGVPLEEYTPKRAQKCHQEQK